MTLAPATSDRVRIGLVGLGDAGAHHARALAALGDPGVDLAVLCARDPERIARFRDECRIPAHVRAFTSLEALLAAQACDAIILATPDGLHAAQVASCAERGVHVLVEKPLALSLRDGSAAAGLCRDRGVVLQVGYHLRHHAGHALVQARRDELVGRLRSIHARWAWLDPAVQGWRARGEEARFWSLAALGTHAIDLALWMAGVPVVEARGVRVPAQGADRAAEVSLRLAGGVLAHVSVSVEHRAVSCLRLTGDEGEVECLGTLGPRGEGEIVVRRRRGEPERMAFTPADPYAAALREFVRRCRERAVGGDAVRDALCNLGVLDALAAHEPEVEEIPS